MHDKANLQQSDIKSYIPGSTGFSQVSTNLSDGAIDRKRLHGLSDGDREFEQELLKTFINDARVSLAALEHAVERAEWHLACKHIHQLKGASANVGAVALAESLKHFEQQAKQQTGAELLPSIFYHLSTIEAEVDSERDGPRPANPSQSVALPTDHDVA